MTFAVGRRSARKFEQEGLRHVIKTSSLSLSGVNVTRNIPRVDGVGGHLHSQKRFSACTIFAERKVVNRLELVFRSPNAWVSMRRILECLRRSDGPIAQILNGENEVFSQYSIAGDFNLDLIGDGGMSLRQRQAYLQRKFPMG